jgi:hypothetical protein
MNDEAVYGRAQRTLLGLVVIASIAAVAMGWLRPLPLVIIVASALVSASATKVLVSPLGVEFDSLFTALWSLMPIGAGPGLALWAAMLVQEALQGSDERNMVGAFFGGGIAAIVVVGGSVLLLGCVLRTLLRLFDWEPSVRDDAWVVVAALGGAGLAAPIAIAISRIVAGSS